MIPIPPIALKFGAYGLILGATYIGGCVRGSQIENARTEKVQNEFSTFKLQVEAAGRSAQAAADERKKLDEQKAKASDESYAKALVALGSDIERMRRARSDTNYLPPAPADTKCPEGWACFDRAELQQAIRRLDEGLSGITQESDSVRLRLETAIRWANP